MKNLVLVAGTAMLLFNACEKISNPADDAKAAGETLSNYSDDQVALDGLSNLIQDVLKNEGRLNKKGAYEVFPQDGIISFSDSLFTDGDGIDFVIDLGLIKKDVTPSQSDLKKGNDGKFYGGKYLISMNLPFNDIGCEVKVTPYYAISSDSLEVEYSDLVIKDSKYMTVVSESNKIIIVSPKGVELGIPEAILNIRRREAEKLELFYNLKVIRYENKGMKNQVISWGNLIVERTGDNNTPDDNSDDIYSFSGNSDAFDVVGGFTMYSVKIDANNPLIQEMECNTNALYVKGIMTLESSNGKSYRFDFGGGDCDSKVKMKVGNLPEVEISL